MKDWLFKRIKKDKFIVNNSNLEQQFLVNSQKFLMLSYWQIHVVLHIQVKQSSPN